MTRESAVEIVKTLERVTTEQGFCSVAVGDTQIMSAKGVLNGDIFHRIRNIGFTGEQLAAALMMSQDIPEDSRFFVIRPEDSGGL